MRQTPHLGSVETTSAIVWSGMNGQMTSVIMWITPLLAWMSNFFKRFPFTVTKPWRNMLVSQEDYQSRKTNVVVVGLEVDVHSVDAPFHRGNHLDFHFFIFYFSYFHILLLHCGNHLVVADHVTGHRSRDHVVQKNLGYIIFMLSDELLVHLNIRSYELHISGQSCTFFSNSVSPASVSTSSAGS